MKRLTSLCLAALAGALLSAPLLAEEMEDSGIDDPHTHPLKEGLDLTSSNRIDYFKHKIIADLVYPTLTSDENPDEVTTFNDAVKALLSDEEDSFKQKVADAQTYQAVLPKKQIHNNLTIDFDSSFLNLTKEPILSVRFVIEGDLTGMAHPEHYHRVLNLILDDDTPLSLDELFKSDSNYLTWLSNYAIESLTKKLGQNTVFPDSLTPTEDHFKLWNLEPSGIRFTFDDGIVAPAVYGTQTIVVPYSQLEPLFDPDSPLSDCFAHQRRCLRNNLMTGGFIDQAINTKHRRLNPVLG